MTAAPRKPVVHYIKLDGSLACGKQRYRGEHGTMSIGATTCRKCLRAEVKP